MSNHPASGRLGLPFHIARLGLLVLIAAFLVGLTVRSRGAQAPSPKVTGVNPDTGKTDDTVTIAGENLEKSRVSAVFLSDDNDDFKASVVSQATDKIVFKVPAVRPGGYHVSIQSGNSIFIQPIRFTVQ